MPMTGPQKHTYKKSSRSEDWKRENSGVGLIKFQPQNVNPIKPMGLKRHQAAVQHTQNRWPERQAYPWLLGFWG
jgi:hypothetical protein